MSDLNDPALDAAAQDADGAGALPVGEGAPVVDAGPNYGLEAEKGIDTLGALVTGYAPETMPLWCDQNKANMTAALTPVLEKHQMTMAALPPEVVLLFVAGPIVYQSAKIIATKMEREKQAALPPRQAPGIAGAAQMPTDRPPPTERHPQEALYQVPA